MIIDTFWNQLLDELAFLQDQGSGGGVVNCVTGEVSAQDTACSSEAFATQYLCSGNPKWSERAKRAGASVSRSLPYSGLPEPIWSPIGWYLKPGSGYVTSTTLDSLWESETVLSTELCEPQWQNLEGFLARCHIKKGKFAHDAITGPTVPPSVQNIQALVLHLYVTIYERHELPEAVISPKISQISRSLISGQRNDGFWSYLTPGKLQKALFSLPLGPTLLGSLVARKVVFRGDHSILFGDISHHCYVLYYLAKASQVCRSLFSASSLGKAWNWTEQHLRRTSDGTIRLAFESEPWPRTIRYCNFCDTTAYFLILAALPLLKDLGVVSRQGYDAFTNGIVAHICKELALPGKSGVRIAPHEGPLDVSRRILPALWESPSWKAALLSRYLRSVARV